MGLLPLMITLYTNLSTGFELWVKRGEKGQWSGGDFLGLWTEHLPAFYFRIFSFISSLQILARKVSRTHAWQWLPCPVTQRSPENEPHLIVHYPELFTTHLLCPQHTWKRGEDRCLFSVTTCAKVKFKHICGDHALVENVLPCCGMWKMNESGYWRMHSLPLILAA